MGAISFTVSQAAKPDATKAFTVPDAHVDRIIAAYQSPANTDINGTATRAQVLLYWAKQVIENTRQTVISYETKLAQEAIATPPAFTAT